MSFVEVRSSTVYSGTSLSLFETESKETVSALPETTILSHMSLFRRNLHPEKEFAIIAHNSSFSHENAIQVNFGCFTSCPKTSSDAAGDGIIHLSSVFLYAKYADTMQDAFLSLIPKTLPFLLEGVFLFLSVRKRKTNAAGKDSLFLLLFRPKRRRKEKRIGALPASRNFLSERRRAAWTENCIKNGKSASETKFGTFFLLSFFILLAASVLSSAGERQREEKTSLSSV